jgi:uncharacterized protein YwqG
MGRETAEKLAVIERNFTELDYQEIQKIEQRMDECIVLMEKAGYPEDEIAETIVEVFDEITHNKESPLKEKYMKMIACINSGNKRGFTFMYHSYDGKVNGEVRGFYRDVCN